MKELGWNKDNPFMPDVKTADDLRKYLDAGGLGTIEARIEEVFSTRLAELKEKISRLLSVDSSDAFTANILLTSILVDTRALFLESDRQKRNATLQNVYRARNMVERAEAIDVFFDEEVLQGKSMREVIKGWVDKRVVHMDWLWDDDEVLLFKQMEFLIFDGGMKNLLRALSMFVDEYEQVVFLFGKNFQEQIDLMFKAVTGGMEVDANCDGKKLE